MKDKLSLYKSHRRRFSAAPAPDPVGGFFSWLLGDPYFLENYTKDLIERHLGSLCDVSPRTIRRWGSRFEKIPPHYARLLHLHRRCLELELRCAALQRQSTAQRAS